MKILSRWDANTVLWEGEAGSVKEAVYAAIQNQDAAPKGPNASRALLAATTVWGSPGQPGCQTIARFNWGFADLEIKETILAARPPDYLKINQRPQRFVPGNPDERPIARWPGTPADHADFFARTYGTPPATTELTFTLHPFETGTTLLLDIDFQPAKRLGLFGRWLWRKRIRNAAGVVFDQILAALAG